MVTCRIRFRRGRRGLSERFLRVPQPPSSASSTGAPRSGGEPGRVAARELNNFREIAASGSICCIPYAATLRSCPPQAAPAESGAFLFGDFLLAAQEKVTSFRAAPGNLNQRGVPNACVQYTPISLLGSTAKATPISVNAGFIRLAQCSGLLIQPATASSGFICPAAMFSPIERYL